MTAKEEITRIIEGQPADSSFDELLRELAFRGRYNAGSMIQSRAGRSPTRKCG